MKIFFATDIHGSEVCWKKFLNSAAFYKADLVILGGDVTGKVMVPIIVRPGSFEVTLSGETPLSTPRKRSATSRPRSAIVVTIRRGFSRRAVGAERAGRLDRPPLHDRDGQHPRSLARHGRLQARGGKIPCILNGGNDDTFEIDGSSKTRRTSPSPKARSWNWTVSISPRWATRIQRLGTPFERHQEADLAMRIEHLVSQIPDMGRAIFNFHAPPLAPDSTSAPALDETFAPRTAAR